MAEFNAEENKDLAYDLRQIYAKLVGGHLVDITEARKAENFYAWFKALEDLHTIVRFKFKDPEQDEKDFQEKRNAVVKLANKHLAVWNGSGKDEKAFSEIELSLHQLEQFLYDKMNEANMFGSKWEDEGL